MPETLLLPIIGQLSCLSHLKLDKNIETSLFEWIRSKKFKATDFAFINVLKTETEMAILSEALYKCYQLGASFSETLQILELVTELVLINPELPIVKETTHIESWKLALKNLRFPQTTLSDQDLKFKLEKLPWPAGAKIKFERRGDRAGIELKLFITSSADLTKSIAALERVQSQL